METIKLSKPLLVNGEERAELPCDMDAVTLDGFCRAEAKANAKRQSAGGSGSALAEQDYSFHVYLAFEGCVEADPSLDVADLERLTGRDIVKLMQVGRFFALGADGESAEGGSDEPSASTRTSTAAAPTR